MDELERADRLARALDRIIDGEADEAEGPDMAGHEIESLLEVARRRHESAQTSRQSAMQYESTVWGRLVERLESSREDRTLHDHASELAGEKDASELAEIIAMRRGVSNEMSGYAEQHRDEVWRRIHDRLEQGPVTRRRFLPWSRPVARGAVEPGSDGPDYSSGNPQFDSLVRAALARAPVSTRHHDTEMTRRLWARVGGLGDARELRATIATGEEDDFAPGFAVRVLAVAAAAFLLIAALGPVPTSGLASHPLLEAITSLAGGGALTEEKPTPPVPDVATPVEGIAMPAEEAADVMDLPVGRPSHVPSGFGLESSRYFPAPITATNGGLFVLIYTNPGDGSALSIYQESAAGLGLVAESGSTIDARFSRQLATYFEGGWQPEDGRLLWQEDGSQTLVFETRGVRVIIHHTGTRLDPREVLAIADSMAYD
jgi:hypothetical protein